MITCANCGAENEPGAVFCRSCSHFLAWAEAPTAARPKKQPARKRAPRPSPAAEPEPAANEPTELAAPQPQPEREPPEPPDQPQAPAEPAEPASVRTALEGVAAGRRLALLSGRDDLAAHLDTTSRQIAQRAISVAVVGEFKRGKSALINALLQSTICPVDADIVTAVPTVVRFGDSARAYAYAETTGEQQAPQPDEVQLEQLAAYVSEEGNPGNRRRLTMVEVLLPHPMLRSGVCLIDTPGVGGLDSAHGILSLGALSRAQGMLFVTDASQELTRAELDFLASAVERCPNAACVVTKTDLYMEWRRIAEIDEGHLRRAGLNLPVLPVSSFLRMAAIEDRELLTESGFPALVDFLLGTIVAAGTEQAVRAAEAEVEFVAAQLEDRLRAEEAVLEEPERAEAVVEQLHQARERSRRLDAPTATWQQMLTDGIQDLVAEVEFDLQERLRAVLRDAEAIVDEGDPRQTWPDIEVWLRRQVIAAAVANHDRMNDLADELAADVAEAFNFAAGSVSSAAEAAVTDSVARVPMATAASLEAPGGRVASMVIAGRTATLVPMILLGALGHLLLPVIAPVALVLAGGIGQKIIRDERRRQVAYRRQQAKSAARRYIDEVAFLVSKDSRDALRTTQRALRDDFSVRAVELHRSAETTLQAVRDAATLEPQARQERLTQVAEETAQVVVLRARRSSQPAAVANG